MNINSGLIRRPVGSENEFDPLDLAAKGEDGRSLIPPDSQVRFSQEGGEKILRHGYSFTDGVNSTRGQLDAGLFFVCFKRDQSVQFVLFQRRLAENDALSEYILHTGSAVFACPPGAREDGYVGEILFDNARTPASRKHPASPRARRCCRTERSNLSSSLTHPLR